MSTTAELPYIIILKDDLVKLQPSGGVQIAVFPREWDYLEARMSVHLKFPRVRLMVYDALVEEHAGCAEAIVSCAHQMGLIRADRLAQLKAPTDTEDGGSLYAAEQVLRQCLTDRGIGADADRLWAEVKRRVQMYKKDTALADGKYLAPVVMDLLVQQLQPYV